MRGHATSAEVVRDHTGPATTFAEPVCQEAMQDHMIAKQTKEAAIKAKAAALGVLAPEEGALRRHVSAFEAKKLERMAKLESTLMRMRSDFVKPEYRADHISDANLKAAAVVEIDAKNQIVIDAITTFKVKMDNWSKASVLDNTTMDSVEAVKLFSEDVDKTYADFFAKDGHIPIP